MIELDLHVFRRRVEVRHEKVLWPTGRLWERWYLLPRDRRVFTIDEILDAVEPDTRLLLDLKCFRVSDARRIRRAVPEEQPAIVSSRNWWVMRAFKTRPATPLLRSCRSRWQLWLALFLPRLGDRQGIVAHQQILDREVVGTITSKTPLLFSWAIESAARGRDLADAGVNGLIVDDLDLDLDAGRPHPD